MRELQDSHDEESLATAPRQLQALINAILPIISTKPRNPHSWECTHAEDLLSDGGSSEGFRGTLEDNRG